MSNELNDLNATPETSTTLDRREFNEQQTPQDGLDAPQEKPGSVRDAIAKAFDDEDAKATPEPPKEVKADKPADEGKEPAPEARKAKDAEPKPDETAEPEKSKSAPEEDRARQEDDKRSSEERQRSPADQEERASTREARTTPPKQFISPRAKESWYQAPVPVKMEVHRIMEEAEREREQYREAHDEWTKLEPFRAMAKQYNTDISGALQRYTAADAELKNDFGRGVAGLARSYGHQPAEAIAHVLRGFGITPEQYAAHVTQNPQAHRQQPPAQPQANPEVQALRAELEAIKQQTAAERQEAEERRVRAEILEPFAAQNPRFNELQEPIAKLLQSDLIPSALSPQERLEIAYDMADRINPAPRYKAASPEPELAEQPQRDVSPAPVDEAGKKSIRGAPSGGFNPAQTGRARSRRSAIESALAEFGA